MNSFYSSMFWAKRKKLADLFHEEIYWQVKEQKIPKVKEYPVKISYKFFLSGRLPDVDNVAVKLVNDGLRYAGVLENDSPKFIKEITVSVEKGDDSVLLDIFPCGVE